MRSTCMICVPPGQGRRITTRRCPALGARWTRLSCEACAGTYCRTRNAQCPMPSSNALSASAELYRQGRTPPRPSASTSRRKKAASCAAPGRTHCRLMRRKRTASTPRWTGTRQNRSPCPRQTTEAAAKGKLPARSRSLSRKGGGNFSRKTAAWTTTMAGKTSCARRN